MSHALLRAQSSFLPIAHNIPIPPNVIVGITSINKWSNGLMDKNWLREHYWLTPEQNNGIFELKRVGVPVDTLKRAGYEASELLNGGYSETELLKAGYKKSEIH